MGTKTFVIAEAGSTWRIGHAKQHLRYARQAIHIAQEAGADAVKFQWCSEPRAMVAHRKVDAGSYDILGWPEPWLAALQQECWHVGVEFMCTVFLQGDIKRVDPFVKRFKVASLEALNEAFVRAHWAPSDRRPLYVSLGALSYKDIHEARWLQNCTLLQCTASYPAPLASLNLAVLRPWDERGSDIRGLSDHSADPLVGALAVAAGAEIIEVHFRLDKTPRHNPDFRHSLTPSLLGEYIANVRKAELAMGDGVKRIEACEEAMTKHRVMP